MKKLLLIPLLVLLLAACDNVEPGVPVTWDTFCDEENKDKRVAIEGYVYLPVTALVSDTMLLDLFEEPNRRGRETVFSMVLGGGANNLVEPPDSYTDADLLLRDKDGTEVRTGARIRVEGLVLRSQSIDDPNVYNCQLFTPTVITALSGS